MVASLSKSMIIFGMITYGEDITFGIPDLSEIDGECLSYVGFPEFTRIKLRLRPDEFAQAFTKHEDGSVKHWYIKVERNGNVLPAFSHPHGLSITSVVDKRTGRSRTVRCLTPL